MKDFWEELYRNYRDKIEQSPLKVHLIASFSSPFNLSVASARSCYSSKGLYFPDDMEKSPKDIAIRDRVARLTYQGGHLTTREHPVFVLGIEGVSRFFIWQVLHFHRFYNSEQVSQRYVRVDKEKNWYILPLELLPYKKEVEEHLERTIQIYKLLIQKLLPVVRERYFSIHKLKARTPEKYEKDVEKKAQEVARYILPLLTKSYLYHTVNLLTLYRYLRLALYWQIEEAIIFALKVYRLLVELDPLLKREIPTPLEIPTPSYEEKKVLSYKREFDASLKKKGRNSSLLVSTNLSSSMLPSAISFLKEERIFLEDTLSSYLLTPIGREGEQITFTFKKKLSLTADAQEERHRALAGARPLLWTQLSLDKDYIIPRLIKAHPKIEEIYTSFLDEHLFFLKKLYQRGVSPTSLVYLLPNAYPVRYLETGTLAGYFHKWKMRLCYNAQEEIFHSSLEEVLEVKEHYPDVTSLVGPPCVLREHLRPRCTEGEHFCGIKVWKYPFEEYQKRIL